MNLELTFTAAIPEDQACLAVGDDNIVRGLAVPFGVPSGPSSSDGRRYQFDGPPDNADELVDVVREHDDDAILGALAKPWETTPDGLRAHARYFDTQDGRDALTLAREGRRRGFSVKAGIKKFTETADGVRKVTSWDALHLGTVRRPAFAGAGIQFSATATKESTVTTTTPEVDVADLAAKVLELPPVKELSEKVQNLPTVAELAEQVAEIVGRQTAGHPLAAFATAEEFYAEFLTAARAEDTDRLDTLQAAFAVPDQVTSENPGVVPPGWRTDIKANVQRRQPAIRAFGTIGLPDSGMTASWPYLDPALDIDGIIAEQLTEKAELQGVDIKILKGDEPIRTAGAVSDISYQLLLRSSPSYLAAHNNILMAAFARYLEAKFEARLFADGTDAGAVAPTTAADLRTVLFTASAAVEDATGSPADIVLASSDLWLAYGGLAELYNSKYGTNNAAGTSDARSLVIDVNGMRIERAPFLPDDTLIVASSDAAKAPTSGPQIATAEDVRRLGRDVAVWGMYEEAEIYFPGGIQVYQVQA